MLKPPDIIYFQKLCEEPPRRFQACFRLQEIELPQFEARERIIEVPMSLIEETYVAWPGGSTWEGAGIGNSLEGFL